jgi:DnaK suppressor protein
MAIDTKVFESAQARLLARRTELRQRRDRVGRDLARQNEPLSADSSDRAIQLENDEPLAAIGNAATRELGEIEAALHRIASGLYGTCEVCGEPITAARLAAIPQAVTCEHCQKG